MVNEVELWNMVMRLENAAIIPSLWMNKHSIIVFSFSLLSLTIEIHLTITYPLTHPRKMTPRKMTCLIMWVWIFCLINIIASASLQDYGKPPYKLQICTPVWYILVSCMHSKEANNQDQCSVVVEEFEYQHERTSEEDNHKYKYAFKFLSCWMSILVTLPDYTLY